MMDETGSGKSIKAVAIADRFREAGRRPIIIVPKTLQNNFKDNIVKYKMKSSGIKTAEKALEHANSEYNYVSSNANNMMTQLKRVSQPTELQDAIDEELGISHEDEEDKGPATLAVGENRCGYKSIVGGSGLMRMALVWLPL